ncbi:MAG: hypothetical protein A2138_10795 [Deltaproteobacteria bacterium RBG_16_71_12]|nr:MAG: hypothetical protein A2138_10795 [Deltaproteobacteria bacterium RBG_16_71_12]
MPKTAAAAALLATLTAPAIQADAARAEEQRHGGALPNAYFSRDPANPKHLTPTEPALALDAGYAQIMAHPRIPRAVHEELRTRFDDVSVTLRASDAVPNPALAVLQSGNVLVVEGTSSLVTDTQAGVGFNHNNGLFSVAEIALSRLGDNYDFITIFTTFSDQNVAAYYMPLRQDVEGLGPCDGMGDIGCVFDSTDGMRLQGVVFMNSADYWRYWDRNYDGVTHELESFDSSMYSTLGQEVAHRWGSSLRFVDPRTGNVSNKLIGRDGSHWAAWVDTDASVMDGWDWSQDGGEFKLVNDMDRYSTLDLYTMGALPVASAQPFFFIDGARFTERDEGAYSMGLDGDAVPADAVLQLPGVAFMEESGIYLGATGERVDLTIQDVVNAEGNRCPDADHTQKAWRQAVVLVTNIGQTAAEAAGDVADLETVIATWEAWWSDRTARALTLCAGLDEECVQPEAELSGGDVRAEAGDVIEAGTTMRLRIASIARVAPVTNARLLLTVKGSGADYVSIESGEVAVGDIDVDATVDTELPIELSDEYPCGTSFTVEAILRSDNAADVRERYKVFPGTREVFAATFKDGDDGFEVDAQGEDDAGAGAFERVDVGLSCAMSKRTPERDLSPTDKGAFVTGAGDELDGSTSLTSPEIDLAGTVDPEIKYGFWLDADGEGAGRLLVHVSNDGGKTFTRTTEEAVPAHDWGIGSVNVKEALKGIPPNVVVRFTFEGDGRVEGAIDDVVVTDRAGRCRAAVCGCSADGGAAPQAAVAALIALLGLARLARRPGRRRA